ncbi:MAG TPA: hypothetical protein VFS08_09415 [Gemmatimonadaceae bacterium]|nr:hypothetical protein [Gemmatimonadaceae bacterium]
MPHNPLAWTLAGLVAAAAALPADTAAAQRPTLIRELPAPIRAVCPAPAPRGPAPGASARAESQRLAEAAGVRVLAGDLSAAREQLRRATALDPTSTELAYRLARTYEDLGDARAAADEYCRVLDLDPPAAERGEAETRLAELAARLGAIPAPGPAAAFEDAIARYDAGDLPGAEAAFTAAVTGAPGFAAAYLDRALTRIQRGRAEPALEDLERFARLAPRQLTPDLRRTADVLRRARFSPATALAAGLLPGGAQLYTDRPQHAAVLGLVAAGGLYLVFEQRATHRRVTAVDPFGNPYEYVDPRATIEHPRRGLGLSIAGLAILGGALEGYLYARGGRVAFDALAARLRVAPSSRTAPR